MDFREGRRGPAEERFSGLSEGQRYALALVLNLAFVGAVIAGFAFLYTSGFKGAPRAPAGPTAPAETARSEPAAAPSRMREITVASLDDAVSLELEEEAARAAGPATPVTPVERPASGPRVDAERTPSAAEEEPAAFETAALEPAAAPAPESAVREPAAPQAAVPEPAARDQAATPPPAPAAPAADPIGSLWAAAGALTANLQSDYPCSQFTLQAGSDGEPALRARVGGSDDLERVRARVSDAFAASSEVDVGLGCTTVIGAGYVALSDQNGRVSLLSRAGLGREIVAVLPRESTCEVIGQVVANQAQLSARLADAGHPAVWVRAPGGPALCESADDGMWRLAAVTAADGGRRAAALVLSDDVVAGEARRAANLADPAPAEPALTRSAPADAPGEQSAEAGSQRVEVAPVDGPSPRLPDGVAPPPGGYTVSVGFTVNDAGRAEDLTVLGAGMASVPVVAAALDVVTASRFPTSADGAYRARHTVRFPSAQFDDLLTRLSLVTAEERTASAIWDRSLTQADFDRAYPRRALDHGVEGAVAVECRIGFDGKLACAVADENPRSWGFGAAALSLAEILRAAPRMSDGGPSANQAVTLTFNFTPKSAD